MGAGGGRLSTPDPPHFNFVRNATADNEATFNKLPDYLQKPIDVLRMSD